MMGIQAVDTALVQWGERLFFPANRIVKADPAPRMTSPIKHKADAIRRRIQAIAVRRAPQVVVKVAGGGRGMRDIAAHFRYISRDGVLTLEDDRGVGRTGSDGLQDLADQWRYGGSRIPEVSHRREALNLMLSMPHGTDPAKVLAAARAFGKTELTGNFYVMVLHEHQAHPHVHLTLRSESRSGERLRSWHERYQWRESFAEKLRELGVDAEATPQWTRGELQRTEPLWRKREQLRDLPHRPHPEKKSGEACDNSRAEAMRCWAHIMQALGQSSEPADRQLADQIDGFVRSTPFLAEVARRRQHQAPTHERGDLQRQRERVWTRADPELIR